MVERVSKTRTVLPAGIFDKYGRLAANACYIILSQVKDINSAGRFLVR